MFTSAHRSTAPGSIARAAFITAGMVAIAMSLAACRGGSEKDLIASARAHIDKKEPRAAVIELKSALQANPQSPEARLLLGKSLLASGDPVAATVELRKAQDLYAPNDQLVPELARAMAQTGEQAKLIAQFSGFPLGSAEANADLLTTVAAAHATLGDAAKAREVDQAALQQLPNYAPALVLRARLQAAAGEFDAALAQLDEVLARDPGDESAGLLKGDILRQGRKDPQAALAAYRKVLAANPKSLTAHTATIKLLDGLNKPDEAKAQFAELKKVAPDHPETLYFEAQLAFANKDYKSARALTDRVLKVAPENVLVLQLAGAAEYRMNNDLQASALLAHAVKNAPGLLLARQLLAQTYLRSSEPDKAIEALQPLLDGPQGPDGPTLALAGEAWLQTGELKKSEAAFQRAAKAAPGDARVRTAAAMAQVSRGNSSLAIPELEAIAAEDKGTRADLALISVRLRQNDRPGALKAIDGLARKQPDRPLADNLRGRVQLLQHDLPAAAKSFEAALGKDPNYFPAVASLAAIELDAGKPEAARKRFEALLVAKPNHYQALLALAELNARTGAPPEEVLRPLRAAAKGNPGELAPQLALIDQLIASGDTKAALQAAQDAGAALPNNLVILESLGRAQLAAGDGNRAVTTFKRLADLQPRQALHQVRLAEAYVVNQDRPAAARALRQALEIRPGLLAARRAQVTLALLDQRPQDALAVARAIQQEDPRLATGYEIEGDIESSRKNWDAAATGYRGALQRGGASGLAMKLHGVQLAAGHAAEAERMATDWIKGHPADAAFLYHLGDAALARSDWAAAEARYRAVVELQPRNALALNNVAWLMVKQGRPGAVAVAEKAIALLPDRAPLLDTLATALAAENQVPKAIETQKRAVARSPQDPNLKLNLARLYVKAGDKAYARAELNDLAKLGDKFAAQPEVASLLKSL